MRVLILRTCHLSLSLKRQDCRALIDLPLSTAAEEQQTLADIVSKLNNEELFSGFETYFDVQNGIIGGGATARAQVAAAKE